MKKFTFLFFLFLTTTTSFAQMPKKAEYVPLKDGKQLYYEAYGEGEPLILLHGYTLSSRMWAPFITDFQEDYEVYLIDLTGHGKSSAFQEDLSIRSVGKDLNEMLQYLQLEKVNAIGFSYGGDVLFQLAILNPSLVESMIAVGAVGTWDVNNHPDYLGAFVYENLANFPWITAYHSTDLQIRALFQQFKNYTVRVTNEELKNIQSEVMLVFGDDDEGIQLEEAFRARKHLPYSDLWIIPDQQHSVHEGKHKAEFVEQSKVFFAKKK